MDRRQRRQQRIRQHEENQREREQLATERAPQVTTRERAIYVAVVTFETTRAFERWWAMRRHRWKINKSQRSSDKVDEYWRCNYTDEGRYFICGCCVRIRKPLRGGVIEISRSINIPHRHAVRHFILINLFGIFKF
ncbi:hypothetical protein Mgra_00007765 [Meloidogyne graminicola]|uniref:Uncharacterized protein n=1 Tax=Meloidogyne graminicola TaxID=189291 RepID=A0A8S9ZHM2_9BILA|nr:hypothetical protein Mgra_00007765 [Meloidogyne graminicola]